MRFKCATSPFQVIWGGVFGTAVACIVAGLGHDILTTSFGVTIANPVLMAGASLATGALGIILAMAGTLLVLAILAGIVHSIAWAYSKATPPHDWKKVFVICPRKAYAYSEPIEFSLNYEWRKTKQCVMFEHVWKRRKMNAWQTNEYIYNDPAIRLSQGE